MSQGFVFHVGWWHRELRHGAEQAFAASPHEAEGGQVAPFTELRAVNAFVNGAESDASAQARTHEVCVRVEGRKLLASALGPGRWMLNIVFRERPQQPRKKYAQPERI